jgi:hypothetical protein
MWVSTVRVATRPAWRRTAELRPSAPTISRAETSSGPFGPCQRTVGRAPGSTTTSRTPRRRSQPAFDAASASAWQATG